MDERLSVFKLNGRIGQLMRRFIQDEDAPTFLEYGLLITLIAAVVIVAVTLFGESVNDLFEAGGNAFPP